MAFSIQGGWTIVEDRATTTIWSFAPPGDAAYPAVVKRRLVKKAGGIYVQMSIQCEASKAACDNLVHAFNQLNAQASASLHNSQ